jgi:hypothetical protein
VSGLTALVAEKLQSTAGDWRLFRSHIPRRILERDAYETEVLEHFNVTRSWLEQRALVEASPVGVQVLIALASHNAGFITSARWNAYLQARTADAWLAIANDADPLEANAAGAAATWLDPSTAERASAIRARHGAPFSSEPTAKTPTHWDAWSWGKGPATLHVPSLLTHDYVESFSVRTRIYRSLGQAPHHASAAALREALNDPHPFARAQAARSLGWLSDPRAIEPLQRLLDDGDGDVRRSAKLAVERITGYWTLFGEWQPTLYDIHRRAAAIERLADLGLRAFAYELIVDMPTELAAPLQKQLAQYSLHPRQPRHYREFFDEDRAEMDAINATDPRIAGPSMHRLFAISAQRADDQLAYAERLVGAREPIGWNARRVFRAFGTGTPALRCREAGE